ncbi:MAG: SAM-dependent methyltransferase [Kangiellaceae bacterium]
MKKGRLAVVGTGIITPAHLSQESINRIEVADVVHSLVPDPLGYSTLEKLNSNIKDLGNLYFDQKSNKNGTNRHESYILMVDSVLKDVRAGMHVCAIFYGHPGVFVYPSHQMVKQAKKEGFDAEMLPAISAEDCLFADLGVDPGDRGCQAYEASQFLFYHHSINPNAALILWQIGVVGDETLTKLTPSKDGLFMLREKLLEYFPDNHKTIVYEASILPIIPPRTEEVTIQDLVNIKVNSVTTLYVPPLSNPRLNIEFCKKWKVDIEHL